MRGMIGDNAMLQSPSPSMGEGLGWGCVTAGDSSALMGDGAQPSHSPQHLREHPQPCPIEGEGFPPRRTIAHG